MFDYTQLTLMLYVLARMSGFVLFNPILGRKVLPGLVRSGLILTLSVAVMAGAGTMQVRVPATVLELLIQICLELSLGFLLGMVMNFFFYIPQLAGEVIDTQMGMTMNQQYDPGSQANLSVTGVIINALMTMLFFVENGHHTLIRILMTSQELVPYGMAAIGTGAVERCLELFVECTLLAVKLSLPVLAAELVGQLGMGVLMKAIPQINVFSINLELKILIGLSLLLMLLAPIREYLLQAEIFMLNSLSEVLSLT